jgi:chaperone modulatory protein CbpM
MAELADLSGLPASFLDALVECGALPVHATRFASETVVLARAAQGLREHFELDEQGLAVAVALLRRVRLLEAELSGVQARSMATVD